MKKAILILTVLALLVPSVCLGGDELRRTWTATSIDGGGSGSLDGSISGVSIGPHDSALVTIAGTSKFYVYKARLSSATENSPSVIAPDDVGLGVTRWHLISETPQPTPNLLSNSRLGYWSYSDGPHKMSGVSVTSVVATALTIASSVTPINVGDQITFCGSGSNEPNTGVSVYEILVKTDATHFTLDRAATSGVTDAYLAAPGRVAADAYAGLAGWGRTPTLKAYREQYQSGCTPGGSPGGGLYGLKLVKGAASGENFWWPYANTSLSEVASFRGRTVTFSCEGITGVANNLYLRIADQTGPVATSDAHSGGGTVETLTCTATISPTATQFYVVVLVDADAGDIAWIMHPRLNFGSVDAGYCAPREIIWAKNSSLLNQDYYGGTVTADTTVYADAQWHGRLGKGVTAVYCGFQGICAVAGSPIRFGSVTPGWGNLRQGTDGINAAYEAGWLSLGYNGELYINRAQTWTDVYLTAMGVMY